MKVLVLSTNGALRDGITSWMLDYFSVMDLSNMELHTIVWDGTDASLVKELERARFAIHIVPSRRAKMTEYSHALGQLLLREQFDVIHVCGNSSTMALELCLASRHHVRMRIAHSHNTRCDHQMLNILMHPFLCAFATDFYSCGTDAGAWLFGKRDFTIIPNGKDPQRYAFNAAERMRIRRSLELPEGCTVLGHVGGFNEQKNYPFLLDVFASFHAKHPKSVLILIGNGRLFDEVKARAYRLGLGETIRFLGRRDDVPSLLQAMDCMVFPSLFEGFPNVVIEWQFSGLPSVVSDSVTAECALTPQVVRCSLNAGASEWIRAIEAQLETSDRERDCAYDAAVLASAGYSIRDNAMRLRRLYWRGLERN